MNVLVNLYDENNPLENYRPRAKGGDRPSAAAISASEALENTI
jgi:hypothetical protein